MLGDRKTAVLRGGAPWGFRLSGGVFSPVYIAKVRSRTKAALAGLSAGDTILSINGIPALGKTLLEINDVIGSIRDQLTLEVQSTLNPRRSRYDSFSSVDTTDTSPVRSTYRLTPQPESMDHYSYNSMGTTPTYPTYTSTSNFRQYDANRDQRFVDSVGRTTGNPLPPLFRTASAAAKTIATQDSSTQGQQFNFRPLPSTNIYDTPRSYDVASNSGYTSDINDRRTSSASFRPSNANTLNVPRMQPPNKPQPPPTTYNTKIITSDDQSYYSDSEYVTSGPRYTKILRQANTPRRPSNIVLPIRSMTSKAYDEYVPPETPTSQQKPFDIYRYQQEQAAAAAMYSRPPQLILPSQDQRRKSDPTIDHELGADLKSPIPNKKRYADSSFFNTPYNTYPTIEEQKKMARQIAYILERGDPTQKGASKFEKQRQRAEKYSIQAEAPLKISTTTNYRPLRQLSVNDPPFFNSPDLPDCIKHSLTEAHHANTLRCVGAPDEFKQIHMQEHVTHTMIPPQIAMKIVADLNQSRGGKGAALFQKRKARAEKWVVDENNVKRAGYQPTSSYIGPSTTPWGQHAPTSWPEEAQPYSGPTFTSVRPKFNLPPQTPTLPEPIVPATPVQNLAKFGDFNAKPKGFSSRNIENLASQSPRPSIDLRKPISVNTEPSIREGLVEAHTRNTASTWSPALATKSAFSPQSNDYFNYPPDGILGKWKNQEYSPWNQPRVQERQEPKIAMKHEGVDRVRQRLNQQDQLKQYSANYDSHSKSQGQAQDQRFTDL